MVEPMEGVETKAPLTTKEIVMIDNTAEAEALKNLGNEEFKSGNYQKAIVYYSQALGKK